MREADRTGRLVRSVNFIDKVTLRGSAGALISSKLGHYFGMTLARACFGESHSSSPHQVRRTRQQSQGKAHHVPCHNPLLLNRCRLTK